MDSMVILDLPHSYKRLFSAIYVYIYINKNIYIYIYIRIYIYIHIVCVSVNGVDHFNVNSYSIKHYILLK